MQKMDIRTVFTEFLWDLMLALLSSSIFYFIVVYLPQKKKDFNSMNFLLLMYKKCKIDIIECILNLKSKDYCYQKLNDHYTNFEYIRIIVTDEDLRNLRELDQQEIKEFAIETSYSLEQLKTFLLLEVGKDYIQTNKEIDNWIRSLIFWIDAFSSFVKTLNVRQEDDKCLYKLMDDFVRGQSTAAGIKTTDQFPQLIQMAYKSTLINCRIYVLIVLFTVLMFLFKIRFL